MSLLAQIKILRKVAEHKSFSNAAEELGLSKSVVTRAVASLESEVGEQLLARTTRIVSLTQAGDAYLARASHLVDQLENLNREVSGKVDFPSGPLRFGVAPAVGLTFITPILSALKEDFPDVEFTFDYSDRPSEAQKSTYDVELRFGMPDPTLFDSIELREVREIIVASPKYLSSHPPIKSFADINLKDWVGFLGAKGVEPTPIYFCESDARIPRVITGSMVLSDTDSFYQIIRDGQGISAVIDLFILDDLKSGHLVEVKVPEKLSYFPYGNSSIYLSVPKRAPKSRTTEAVIEYLKLKAFGANDGV